MLFVISLLINIQQFFHVSHEAGPIFFRNAEPFRLPRFQPIFFSVLRTVSGQT